MTHFFQKLKFLVKYPNSESKLAILRKTVKNFESSVFFENITFDKNGNFECFSDQNAGKMGC